MVEAAGGVVWRRGEEEDEVVVVHRPRYDDWSLPKGKLDAGESFEDAAVREVREEAGLFCRLGPELTAKRYKDNKGRAKIVRWWMMEVVKDEGFEPSPEVDELRWVPLSEAAALLSYDMDRELLEEAF